MNCDASVKLMVLLRTDEQPAGPLAEHLDTCPACRATLMRLRALESHAAPAESPADDALTDRVMTAVRAEAVATSAPATTGKEPGEENERPLRLPGWTAGGALILASLVLIQFSKVVTYLRTSLGSVIDVALGLMLGLALTVYICLLVWSNLSAVRRALRFLVH